MKDKICSFFILLPFIWLSTGMLILKNGDKTMVAMVVISIIATLCSYGTSSIKQNLSNKMLWIVSLITIYGLFSYAYHGLSSTEIRAVISSLLLIAIFPRQVITRKSIAYFALVGAIISTVMIWYWSQFLGISRGNWPINAIPFSTLTASFTLICLIMTTTETNKSFKVIMLIGFIVGSGGLILGETRGVWLGFLCSLIIFTVFWMIDNYQPRYWLYILSVILVMGATIFVLKPKLEQRIVQTQNEYAAIESGNLCTSIGLRLQLWKASTMLIEDHPVIGLGDSHIKKFNELYKDSRISQCLYNLKPAHYHNQYIDKLVKNGVIGLALFLLLLLAPLWLCHKDHYTKYITISLCALLAIASLTDVPFNHGQTLFIFMVYVCLLHFKPSKQSI
ncbi:O-antigen ligase family protein [Photobacterium leiognathi]|uniref:O-antigen ligase family protein n=1 Tax=Photobacterium leiognathi TaxID=553611 RepID=UPI002981A83E|nr:O-antigen ligase family protein [Photobacterium leiognathi]